MFENYVPLGDSMTIDFYAASDAHSKGHDLNEVGAASLLFKNNDELFPEFKENDLSSLFPGIELVNLAFDGATIKDLLENEFQQKLSAHKNAKNLITVTVGGNDLLAALQALDMKKTNLLQERLAKLESEFKTLMKFFQNTFKQSKVIITTLYDPTDDTGIMPCARELYSEFDVKYLTSFNQLVRDLSFDHGHNVAEVYWHFIGHGAMCGSDENFWYWKPHPIEPGLTGASEIRRVWLDVIKGF